MGTYKKACILLLAFVMLFALTACDDDAPIRVLDEPEIKPEYLSFFSHASLSGCDVTKHWSDLFTQTYNKSVYIDFDGAAYYAEGGLSYRELLGKRLESSVPDDLYIINAEDVLEFGKRGYWMDLSRMRFVGNLSKAALYQSTYNGKVFSVPLSFTGFGFAWNVDLLEKSGLSVPKNREEFLQACERLKNTGILPYGANKGFALTVPAMSVGLSKLYGSPDQAERVAALNNKETLISHYLRPGYEFLAMMIERGYLDPRQALRTTPRKEDLEMFLAGKCAFICVSLGDIRNAGGAPFRMELTGLPVLAEGSVAVYGADKRLCVNPKSKHLATALQFIEMVGSVEALEKSAALDKVMSSAKKSDSSAFPSEETLVALLQQPGQIPNQDFSLHFNTWESIRDVAQSLCGGVGVDRACAMLDAKQRADLDVYAE